MNKKRKIIRFVMLWFLTGLVSLPFVFLLPFSQAINLAVVVFVSFLGVLYAEKTTEEV